MNQIDLLQSISKYLARFSEQIKILNANNEFHINIHAENLIVKVLNIVYDVNLRNLNHSISGNYSAIDLLDDDSIEKTAFQVTSTNSIDKVKDCIEKYFRNGVYKSTSRLNIFILTNKQARYSSISIQKKIDTEIALLLRKKTIKKKSDVEFLFDVNKNILDKTDLYKKLNADNDLEKITQLDTFLKNQFNLIDEKEELSNYYKRLKNLFYETVMDDERGMTLAEIYTKPSFSVLFSAFTKDDPRFLNKEPQKFYDVDSRYKLHELVGELLNGQNPLLFNKQYRLLLILGYPGQGKSSFCKEFLNHYIIQGKTELKDIFYFSLRNIRQVREFIYNPLSMLDDEACSATEQNLNKSRFYKSLLVLDGLDELYMRENLKLDEIDRLCIELVRLIEKYESLQIIVTSRYGYIDDEKLNKESILILQLSRFDLSLQLEWLTKYHRYHPDTWLTESKLKLLNTEQKYVHLRELLEQPLLLHMIASVSNEIDENTNRAKIYSQLFNELIERKYAREGQIEILKNIKKEDLRELIREVAFAIFQSGNEYITKLELFKLPATHTFLKLFPEANFRESIKGIMIAFYFKEIEKLNKNDLDEDRSNYAVEFLHKSLREFMTAEKILNSISEQFLDKRKSGKYIIDDPNTALILLNAVFGRQELSSELKYHLKQIISNSKDFDKEELADRLCYFINDFCSSDFLVEQKIGHGSIPIDVSLRIFHGFWYFISCLQLRKNYLIDGFSKERIAQFLRFISVSDRLDISGFDFSFQDLSHESLEKINFIACTFNETNFSNCDLSNSYFSSCKVRNTEFKAAYLDNASFSRSKIIHCNFSYSYMGEMSFDNCTIDDCNFEQAEIRWISFYNHKNLRAERQIEMTITSCSFENTKIDKYSYDSLKKWYPQIINESVEKLTSKEEVEQSEQKVQPNVISEIPSDYKRLVFRQEIEL